MQAINYTHDTHMPLDHFAVIGLRRLGGPAKALAWLKALKVEPVQHKDGVRLSGPGRTVYITWPDRVPGLKTWAGQQTLTHICRERAKAMKGLKDPDALLTFTAPLGGSGLDSSSVDAIDVGFSCNDLSIPVLWRAGVEMLAVVGLDAVSILVRPDRTFGYRAGGRWWQFCREASGKYRGRWSMASPLVTKARR